jgi:hypothetical protein
MQQLPDADFDEHRLAHWHAKRYYAVAICNTCKSFRARLFGRSKTASQFRQEKKFTCQRCSTEKDVCKYNTKDIIRHMQQDTTRELVCLECSPARSAAISTSDE